MSLDLGLPLLPVSIVDTKYILPPGTYDLFPGRATLVIHKPVTGEGYHEGNLDGLILKVRTAIQEGIERYALMLRLYDTPVGVATRTQRDAPMPSIATVGCP